MTEKARKLDPYDTIKLPNDPLTQAILATNDPSSSWIQGTDYKNISFCNGVKVRHRQGAAMSAVNGRLFIDGVEYAQYACENNSNEREWRPLATK